MIRLSPHLTLEEVRCKCRACQSLPESEAAGITTATVDLFERIRARWGIPIRPSSGRRCETHNRRVGGVETSQHLKGKALDLPVPRGVSPAEFLRVCREENKQGWTGDYTRHDPPFVHVDTRGVA